MPLKAVSRYRGVPVPPPGRARAPSLSRIGCAVSRAGSADPRPQQRLAERGGGASAAPAAAWAAMSRGPGQAGPLRSPQGLDLDAEREKIRREIEQLERSLQPGGDDIHLALSDSSLSSGTGSGGLGAFPWLPPVPALRTFPLHPNTASSDIAGPERSSQTAV